MMAGPVKRTSFISLAIVADCIAFYARPLFSNQYVFPWDFRGVQLPLITFLADQLKQGQFALWDPYTYCGNPIYANIQASFFHPLVFLGAALSNFLGPDSLTQILEWVVVLQVCVAGWFTYLLARHIGASQAGACASAVMSQTGAFFASRAEHIGAMMAVAWMPAAWYAVVRMRQRWEPRTMALLGGALGMSVLGGSPAATTAVFGSTLLLSVLLAVNRLATPANPLRAALGCLVGLGLSAVEFLPATELTNLSVAKYRLDWLGSGGGLRWQSLVSLLAPDHYHIFDLSNFNGPGDPTFLYLYCSVAGLGLVLLALFRYRDPWVVCFGLLGAFGFVFMMGDSFPLWKTFYPLIPDRVRLGIHPEFTYCVFVQCMAMLAGRGLTRVSASEKIQFAVTLCIAVDLYLVGSNRPMNCSSLRLEPGLSRDSINGSVALLQGVREISNRELPPSRVDTTGDTSIIWAECSPSTGVSTGSGASPFAPERIIQLRLGLHAGGRSGWYYPVANMKSPALDLLSEKYLLAGSVSAPQVFASGRLKKMVDLPGSVLFENPYVMPRAFVVGSTVSLSFPDSAFALRRGFDFRHSATVERDDGAPELPSLSANSRNVQADVKFTGYSPNRFALAAASDAPGLLVLTESWYPGWEARLDGRVVPIYIADAAFRGVFLPAGQHRLEMEFRPRILLWSSLISLVFVVGVGTLMLVSTGNPAIAAILSVRAKLPNARSGR